MMPFILHFYAIYSQNISSMKQVSYLCNLHKIQIKNLINLKQLWLYKFVFHRHSNFFCFHQNLPLPKCGKVTKAIQNNLFIQTTLDNMYKLHNSSKQDRFVGSLGVPLFTWNPQHLTVLESTEPPSIQPSQFIQINKRLKIAKQVAAGANLEYSQHPGQSAYLSIRQHLRGRGELLPSPSPISCSRG